MKRQRNQGLLSSYLSWILSFWHSSSGEVSVPVRVPVRVPAKVPAKVPVKA
jgi:hypothetical protein